MTCGSCFDEASIQGIQLRDDDFAAVEAQFLVLIHDSVPCSLLFPSNWGWEAGPRIIELGNIYSMGLSESRCPYPFLIID